jgi:hypothetical protein
MQILTLTALAILCSQATAADPPHSFEANVVKIADDDTMTVLLDKASLVVTSASARS